MADKRHTEHGQLWLQPPLLLLFEQHLLLFRLIKKGKEPTADENTPTKDYILCFELTQKIWNCTRQLPIDIQFTDQGTHLKHGMAKSNKVKMATKAKFNFVSKVS